MKKLSEKGNHSSSKAKGGPNDKFVVANYELSNGLTRGLKTVCNLKILHQQQIRKQGTCSHLQ